MANKENKKTEPWRIIVFFISVAYIVFMWVRKGIAEIYAAMPAEQAVPMIATAIAVSLVKAAAIAGAVLLIRWVMGRVKK